MSSSKTWSLPVSGANFAKLFWFSKDLKPEIQKLARTSDKQRLNTELHKDGLGEQAGRKIHAQMAVLADCSCLLYTCTF
jgi:hypothetical protein